MTQDNVRLGTAEKTHVEITYPDKNILSNGVIWERNKSQIVTLQARHIGSTNFHLKVQPRKAIQIRGLLGIMMHSNWGEASQVYAHAMTPLSIKTMHSHVDFQLAPKHVIVTNFHRGSVV